MSRAIYNYVPASWTLTSDFNLQTKFSTRKRTVLFKIATNKECAGNDKIVTHCDSSRGTKRGKLNDREKWTHLKQTPTRLISNETKDAKAKGHGRESEKEEGHNHRN